MGFLRNIFIILVAITLAGCAKSLIQITTTNQNIIHPFFGKTSERNFYYDVVTSDNIRLIWKADAFGSFNNSSVVANDSMVFIADLAGRIHVFNLENGKQLGVLKTKGAIFSTPLVYKFRIYYPLVRDGKKLTEFIVYDYYAGKELYIIEIEDLITNQLLADESGIYLFAEDGTIYKYTYEVRLIWSVETNSKINFVPAMVGNKIFLGTNNGELVIVDSGTGNILHQDKLTDHFFSGATISDGLCYIGDDEGNLFAIDTDNFSLKWKQKTNGRILMNPATDDNNVYVGTMRRNYYCFDKKTGNENWSVRLNGYFNATPIVTKNHLLVPNFFKSLMILDKSNGTLLNDINLENRMRLSPVIIGNKLIIGYDEGIIAAYEFVH